MIYRLSLVTYRHIDHIIRVMPLHEQLLIPVYVTQDHATLTYLHVIARYIYFICDPITFASEMLC